MRPYKTLLVALLLSSHAFADGEPMRYAEEAEAARAERATMIEQRKYLPVENVSTVKPGGLRRVDISQGDVNLLRCESGTITDRTYSEEKPLIYKQAEESIAYVKLAQQQVGAEIKYYTKEIDLYMTCNGEVYSLMLVPKPIPTQHIVLSPGRGHGMEQNISMFRELDWEDAALTLIDKVQFSDDMPASFGVSMASIEQQWEGIIPTVRARLIRSVKPEGVGLVVHEYVVFSENSVPLNEFDFVHLRKNTFAVRLSSSTLQANVAAKAFVVERMWR